MKHPNTRCMTKLICTTPEDLLAADNIKKLECAEKSRLHEPKNIRP